MANFKEISRPSFTRKPLEKNCPLFRGRTSEINKIIEILNRNMNASIVGQGKIGKTSLLWNLEEKLRENNYIPVYFDMLLVGCKTNRYFLIRLSRDIRETLSRQGSNKIDSESTTTGGDDEIYDNFKKDIYNYQKCLDDGQQILIMIDEIETLRDFDNMFSFLRPFCAQNNKLLFILAGYDDLYTVTKGECSNFYNVFEVLQLGGISPDEEAISLINSPFEGFDIRYEDESIDYILQLTGRNPFYLQEMQKLVVDILNSEEKCLISKNDYEKVEPTFFNDSMIRNHFRHFWNKANEGQKLILSVLASKDDPPNQPREVEDLLLNQKHIVISDINYNFERLAHLGFICKEADGYSFSSLLLKKWIRENGPIEQVVAEYRKKK